MCQIDVQMFKYIMSHNPVLMSIIRSSLKHFTINRFINRLQTTLGYNCNATIYHPNHNPNIRMLHNWVIYSMIFHIYNSIRNIFIWLWINAYQKSPVFLGG